MLPFVLKGLSSQDLGLWYVFGSISSLVTLLDFGFTKNLTRNITYAWSGSKTIYKEGFSKVKSGSPPNISLIKNLVIISKRIYLYISIVSLLVLVLLGTPYIYSLLIDPSSVYFYSWIVYSIGVFFNMYYGYWTPLLKGIGAIKESSQIQTISKLFYVIFAAIGIYFQGGLLWLSFMYLTSGFVLRLFSRNSFESKVTFKKYYNDTDINTKQIISAVLPNAIKTGLISLSAWLINRSSILISSLFFGLSITSQLGLTLQLFNFVGGLSTLLFYSYHPELTYLITTKKHTKLKILISKTIISQWMLSIVGILSVIYIAPSLLNLIGSNSTLLSKNYLYILGVILFLEWNHSTFTSLISLENKIPFLWSSIISGALIILISSILSILFNFGVITLILTQGIVQLSFNNWYWPKYYMKRNSFSYREMIILFNNELFNLFS